MRFTHPSSMVRIFGHYHHREPLLLCPIRLTSTVAAFFAAPRLPAGWLIGQGVRSMPAELCCASTAMILPSFWPGIGQPTVAFMRRSVPGCFAVGPTSSAIWCAFTSFPRRCSAVGSGAANRPTRSSLWQDSITVSSRGPSFQTRGSLSRCLAGDFAPLPHFALITGAAGWCRRPGAKPGTTMSWPIGQL